MMLCDGGPPTLAAKPSAPTRASRHRLMGGLRAPCFLSSAKGPRYLACHRRRPLSAVRRLLAFSVLLAGAVLCPSRSRFCGPLLPWSTLGDLREPNRGVDRQGLPGQGLDGQPVARGEEQAPQVLHAHGSHTCSSEPRGRRGVPPASEERKGRREVRQHHGMECARGAAKRRRVSTVESALASIDVLGHLAAFLEAGELCQVRATCKALGSRDDSAFDGLSMTEEVARRIYESASDEEKAMLPRHDGEGWIELYHHLLMLRARLTFDQLVGCCVEYQEGDKAAVHGIPGASSAICGNHIMRAGKHWATFVFGSEDLGHLGLQSVGVIRPLPGWDQWGLEDFHPFFDESILDDLLLERTSRWEGDVHCCHFYLNGDCWYSNWEGEVESFWEGVDNYDKGIHTLGLLLDLDSGTLSLYQNGQKPVGLAVLPLEVPVRPPVHLAPVREVLPLPLPQVAQEGRAVHRPRVPERRVGDVASHPPLLEPRHDDRRRVPHGVHLERLDAVRPPGPRAVRVVRGRRGEVPELVRAVLVGRLDRLEARVDEEAGTREGAAEAQAPREVVPPGRVARRDVRVGVEVHVVAPPRPDPGEGTADPQLRRELVQEAVGGPVEVPPPLPLGRRVGPEGRGGPRFVVGGPDDQQRGTPVPHDRALQRQERPPVLLAAEDAVPSPPEPRRRDRREREHGRVHDRRGEARAVPPRPSSVVPPQRGRRQGEDLPGTRPGRRTPRRDLGGRPEGREAHRPQVRDAGGEEDHPDEARDGAAEEVREGPPLPLDELLPGDVRGRRLLIIVVRGRVLPKPTRPAPPLLPARPRARQQRRRHGVHGLPDRLSVVVLREHVRPARERVLLVRDQVPRARGLVAELDDVPRRAPPALFLRRGAARQVREVGRASPPADAPTRIDARS
ncbi:hypothetical protein THAOC_35454, partial [Thalassiosira oceanica]